MHLLVLETRLCGYQTGPKMCLCTMHVTSCCLCPLLNILHFYITFVNYFFIVAIKNLLDESLA